MCCVVWRYMDLVKRIFKMLQIQDPELSQLKYSQEKQTPGSFISQHPVLDLPFRSYLLLAVIVLVVTLDIGSAYF